MRQTIIARLAEKARKGKLTEADRDTLLRLDMKRSLECPSCWAIRRIAGQAFWRFTCKKCKKKAMHPNTAVPTYCQDCARKFKMCRRCGKPLSRRGMRKARIYDIRRDFTSGGVNRTSFARVIVRSGPTEANLFAAAELRKKYKDADTTEVDISLKYTVRENAVPRILEWGVIQHDERGGTVVS